jgi:hypothetical protein
VHIQDAPEGKFNIPRGHSIGHRKQKKVYMYVCPIPNGFRGRAISLYRRATRHVLTRVAKCIDVDVGFFLNVLLIFLIGIVWGGGVQLGSHRPIVPAPGDYDDGEIGGMIGRGNRSTQRKPAPVPLCPLQTPHAARTRTRAAAVGSQ